jgi:predicted Zn-dependent protease
MKYSKLDEAVKIADELLAAKKDDPYILELKGEIYYFQGKYELAEKAYKGAYDKTESPLILAELAKTQIELGKYSRAISNLKVAVFKDKSASGAYKSLSVAYGKLDNIPVSNYYLAEYYFKIGDKKNCLKALDKALKTLDKESAEYLKAEDLRLELKNKPA